MDIKVRIGDAAKCGDYAYFSNAASNGLYRIHTSTYEVEFLDFFPNERIDAVLLHKRCFAYGNKLVFVPALSRKIVVYNVDSRSFVQVDFDNDIDGEAVLDAMKIDNSVYIFKRHTSCELIKFDIDLMQSTYVEEFGSLIDKYVSKDNPDKFYRISYYDGHFYFGLSETDIIAVWDMHNNKIDTLHTGMDRIINVIRKEDHLLFSLRDKYGIGSLTIDTSEVKFLECNNSLDVDGNTYGCMFAYNEYVITAPAFGKYIHGYKEDKLVFEYMLNEQVENDYKFYRYMEVEDDVWLLPIDTDEIYVLKKNLEIEHYSVDVDDETKRMVLARLLKERLISDNLLYEEDVYSLGAFLNMVKEG